MRALLVSAVLLLLLDAIFLYLMSGTFSAQIYDVQRSPLRINLLGAVLCYALLIAGINYFIITPRKSPLDAFFLGVLVNGVYETTSLSLLKDWRLSTVAIDTLWGGTLWALTTHLTYRFLKL